MHFVSESIEWPPEPPSLDHVAREFGGRVFSFVPQRHLELAGVSVESTNDAISAIALSYSVYVNPDDLDDPINLRRLKDGETAQTELTHGQPAWVHKLIVQSRYPLLWEAVRTSTAVDALSWGSAAGALAQHLDHVAVNAQERGPDAFLTPDSDATDPKLADPIVLGIDGRPEPGIRIRHRGYRAYAATLGDRVLSVVLADDLPIVPEMSFISR
jgi:hypothetical protein